MMKPRCRPLIPDVMGLPHPLGEFPPRRSQCSLRPGALDYRGFGREEGR